MAGTTAPLGILPSSAANVLAWELGLPPAPGRATVLRPGVARFGEQAERLSAQRTSEGSDAAVTAKLNFRLKRRGGKAAYVAQAARELFRYPFPRSAAVLDDTEGATAARASVTRAGTLPAKIEDEDAAGPLRVVPAPWRAPAAKPTPGLSPSWPSSP